MSKTIGITVGGCAVTIGALYLGEWILRAACLRWMMTSGFWQAILAWVQLSIAGAILTTTSGCLPAVSHFVSGTKVEKIIYAVAVSIVACFAVYLVWPAFDFGMAAWWKGFFSSLFGLSVWGVALGTILPAIGGIIMMFCCVMKE